MIIEPIANCCTDNPKDPVKTCIANSTFYFNLYSIIYQPVIEAK